MSLPVCTVNTNNIQNLPDSPTLTSNELKQAFDRSSKDLKDYLNDILLPAVEELVRDEKANLEIAINNKILADNKKKYHIGKIIMTTDDTNPSVYLGFGTWVLWGGGRVPIGVNPNNTKFDTVEKTGGEETHKLTINEMPAHNHKLSNAGGCYALKSGAGNQEFGSGGSKSLEIQIDMTGGGKAHNNLQPYITCYMWKRTA